LTSTKREDEQATTRTSQNCQQRSNQQHRKATKGTKGGSKLGHRAKGELEKEKKWNEPKKDTKEKNKSRQRGKEKLWETSRMT